MHVTRHITRGFCVAGKYLALVTLLSLSGCLVSGSANQSRTGKYVAEETLCKIEPGKTTQGWVAATLGEPSTKNKLDDGTEVWRYDYTEKREHHTAVFLLFGGSDKKETNGSVFVEMKDGVVKNKWRA